MNERAKKILEFWFIKSSIKDWFEKNDNFDKKIRDLFFEDYEQAINNEYDDWQDNSNECVALVILLDQFSRNLFRNNKKAFHQDYKTRLIVNEAVDRGYLEELDENSCKWPIGHPNEKTFYFCGRSSLKDFSYCKLHLLYAYQPKGKKEDVMENSPIRPQSQTRSAVNQKSWNYFITLVCGSARVTLRFEIYWSF